MRILFSMVSLLLVISCNNKSEENTPPLCSITNPSDVSGYKWSETINIEIDADDNDGYIREVRLYIDTVGIIALSQFPYEYEWVTVNYLPGIHTIDVVAEDNSGLEGSDIVNVNLELVNSGSGTFIDLRDNHEYKWIKIGNQTWMAENLAYLPNVSPPSVESNIDPIYYVYDYGGSSVSEAQATENYNTYGGLYNWPAAQIVSPEGWHLPTIEEWAILLNHIDNDEYPGSNGTVLKSIYNWKADGNGYDIYGFGGLPGGYRYVDGYFNHIGDYGIWWSSTEAGTTRALLYALLFDMNGLYPLTYSKERGISVRCVKD